MSASSPQRPPAAGLVNLGNSCFASAVVQSLFLTDAFRSLLTALRLSPSEMQRYGVLRSLQHLFGLLLFGVRSEYRPAGFLSSLPERFHNGSQQDADEFAKFLLDAISSSIADIHKQRGPAGKRKAEEMEAAEMEKEEERKQPQPLRDTAQSSNSGVSSSSIAAAESGSSGSSTTMTDISPPQPRLSQGKIRGGAQSSPPLSAAAAAICAVPPAALPAVFAAARVLSPSSASASAVVSPPAVLPASADRSAALPQHDVDANFGGLARSCITCLRCGLQSVKDEAFLELPLPMQQMDSEQRRQLQDSIHRAREDAQRPPPMQQTQQTVSMEVEKAEVTDGQQAMQAEEERMARSIVPEQPNLPLSVLARIAQFASPIALPLSRSLRTAHSAQQHSPRARLAASPAPPSRVSSTGASTSLSSPPAVVNQAAVSATQPAVTVASAFSSSVSSSPPSSVPVTASLPRLLSSTDRLNSSAMQDSPISSVMSPSSASVFLPASSSFSSTVTDPETAAKLLAACLAQFALQAQALTSVATLTTAAAIALKVKSSWEEQQSAEREKESTTTTAAASAEQCTALVIYAPPPHSQLQMPAASSMDAASASPLSNAADGFSLVGSTWSSPSSSSSSSSSASLLHLPAMLELYLSPELLAGADAYHCSHCSSKQAATKALTVHSPPPHLLICLKRNEYHADSRTRTKILTEVKFPCILHLPVTAPAPASASASVSASSAACTSACTYALYSVVVHSGLNADSGHYYAIGRWSGQLRRRMREEMRRRRAEREQEAEAAAWLRLGPELEEAARAGDFFLFNDASVSAASFSTIAQVTKRQQQDVAYLLFYVRLDGEAEGDGDEQEAVDPLQSVNPMLRKLAELEQLSFRRQQEKAVREAVQAAVQTLPKMPAYDTAAMQDYTDPDQ